MNKIDKMIRSALNNSSANEAAQALKMAAVLMQKEGVNPASVLQEKEGVDHRAELERLKAENINLKNRTRTLDLELEAAKRASANPTELREAKELAIKWHRAAQELEKESREITLAALTAQEELKHAQQSNKNRLTTLGWVGGLVGVVACMISYGNGKDYGLSLNRIPPRETVQTVAAPVQPSRPVSQEPTPPRLVNVADKAVCYTTKPDKGILLRFSYNTGEISVFVKGKMTNNKWVDVTDKARANMEPLPATYDSARFIREAKESIKNGVKCKTGVTI